MNPIPIDKKKELKNKVNLSVLLLRILYDRNKNNITTNNSVLKITNVLVQSASINVK